MERQDRDERLSQIATKWTLLRQAHGPAADAATEAQHALMQRYCGVVYRYLLGALRDEDAAEELFQEFALRFLRGDFRRADPAKGRFRDYVKTALVHLVTDRHRRRAAHPLPLTEDHPDPQAPRGQGANSEDPFVASWREELINQTWQALAQAQPAYHAVLLLRAGDPDTPSAELADRLAEELHKPMTAGNVRVMLHRARDKFADLLVQEVARSLQDPTRDALDRELRDLGLFGLCTGALERRRP